MYEYVELCADSNDPGLFRNQQVLFINSETIAGRICKIKIDQNMHEMCTFCASDISSEDIVTLPCDLVGKQHSVSLLTLSSQPGIGWSNLTHKVHRCSFLK